jgi:glycosyltransferase involved in cell wall biosynthesis
MRIAQVAPLTEAVPPKLYGGTERVVHWLTEELVALGNDVTLFASGDSQTSAKLDATWPKALRLDGSVRDPNALHMVMLERVLQKCDDEEFDFLHFHLDYYPFSLFSRQPTPFLTTLHGRLDLPEHQPVFTTFSAIPVISISNAQRRPVPQANWVRTIHHGVPEKLLTPRPVTPSYLAVLGRIAPEKGGRSRHQNRHTMRHPAQDRGKSRSGRSGLLRRNHSPADGPPARRLHRRNRRS